MSFKFSQKLIDQTIKCFQEEDGIELSPELTNEYLESFARLYLAFARKTLVKKFSVGERSEPALKRGSDAHPDLISPHNCKDE